MVCRLKTSWRFFSVQALGLMCIGLLIKPTVFAGEYTHNLLLESAQTTRASLSAKQLLALRSAGEWQFESFSLEAELLLRHQSGLVFDGSDEQGLNYDFAGEPRDLGAKLQLEIRDFHVEGYQGDYFYSIGKQQSVWGRADGLKVLDLLNPQSFQQFILEAPDQSRIPLWSFNIERRFNAWSLQWIWIPDLSYNELAGRDSLFALSSPLLTPKFKTPAVEVHSLEKPGNHIRDSDFATSVSRSVGSIDVSFYYLYHYVDNPVYRRQLIEDRNLTVLSSSLQRNQLFGASFALQHGDWVTRGELALNSRRYFLMDDYDQVNEGIRQQREYDVVLGLDYFGISQSLLSLQIFQSYIPDAQSLVRHQNEYTLTMMGNYRCLSDRLVLALKGLWDAQRGDGLLRPRVSFEVDDRLNLAVGAEVFFGDENGLFGQFKQNDWLYFELKYALN